MFAATLRLNARSLLGAVMLSTLMAGTAFADSHQVLLSTQVDTAGLDLTRTADARTLYQRIAHAADFLCTRGNRVGLAPVDDQKVCYEKAVGNAVRSANAPQLTQMYLATHTLLQAAAFGIQVPAEVAARE